MPTLHTQYHYCTPDWSLYTSIAQPPNQHHKKAASNNWTGIWTGTLEWNTGMEYGMDYGILTKASTGGSRSVTITILSAVQCKSEMLQFTVHANNCFSDSSQILVCMWLHDRRWAGESLFRVWEGEGGREGGRVCTHPSVNNH